TLVPGSPFPAGGIGDLSLAVSQDDKFLFCGTASGVSSFTIAADGSLSPVPGSPFALGITRGSLRVSPDGKFLFASIPSSPGSGFIAVASISSNGALTAITGSPFSGTGPGALAGIDINCAGTLLFATSVSTGPAIVNVFNVGANGALSGIPGSPFTFGGLNSNIPGLSPNEKFL